MDKELIKKYLTMFQVTIIIVVVSLAIAIVLLMNIVPQITSLTGNKAKLVDVQSQLTQKQNELQQTKAEIAQKNEQAQDTSELRSFYRSIKNVGNSSSEILQDEIAEIHDLISYYGIKIYKENNEYDIEGDPFYAADKNLYSVCRMNLEMFSTYMKFQSFLSDVYKHPHFLDIASIEVNPYKKDKTILDIKMQLVVYAEKGANNQVPSTAQDSSAIPPAPGTEDNSSESLDLNIDLAE